MSRYQETSSAPWVAAVLLLVVFVGVVVFATGGKGDEAPATTAPTHAPIGEPVAERPPAEVAPPADDPPPATRALTAAAAELALRQATGAWREFTLELCRREKWPSPRAVAFLEKVTWNDRDKEKQHGNGLASIRRMLGTDTEDPVAVATALQERGGLASFFEKNWSKVDVKWTGKTRVNVLDDAWKPKRVQWGFPLDTPVNTLQEFKRVHLAVALEGWRALAGMTINDMQIDDAAKGAKFLAAIGRDPKQRETKMLAALRVLVDSPQGSVREVVDTFFKLAEGKDRTKLAQALVQKMDAALKAAEQAE